MKAVRKGMCHDLSCIVLLKIKQPNTQPVNVCQSQFVINFIALKMVFSIILMRLKNKTTESKLCVSKK